MITFSCFPCQKQFSVKDELAGKKGKCPGCGQMVPIPAPVASPATEEMAPLPPLPGPQPAGQDKRTNAQTHPSSGDLVATQGFNKPEPGHDSSLTDFLAPPQADDELGRLGKYRILKILGHGGMGVVFKAEDPRLKRKVAIKAMLPGLAASASAGQRFLREAQAMAAVKHDHIATIYQVDEERGIPFLAMEFLVGEPLDKRLKRDEKLSVGEVLRIGREIAEGLAAAHATGLIHRDIKPGNIWLEARPAPLSPGRRGQGEAARVKLLDFGLARAVSQDAGLTQQGAIIGTPAYMAPEQGRGEAVDARGDLFSLGVVLYRLCTGKQPFQGKTILSTLREVDTHQPPPPVRLNAEMPQGLSDLVMQLLEKDPEQRPASAGVVVERLQTLEKKLARQRDSQEETVALKGPPVKPASGPRRRRWPLVIAAAVLLAGLMGLGAFTLIRIQSDQGDYVFDTDDPDFSLRVNKGAVTLEDRKTNRKYDLKVVRQDKGTGEQELEVTDADAGLSFKTKSFIVKRGEKVALKAWFERKQGIAANRGVDDPWVKQVAALPADKQVEAVAAKLKKLNPGFDGKVTHKVEDGVVTELRFVTDKVTDISPVRVFNGLRVLDCSGTPTPDGRGNGQLADLTPLKGMNLAALVELHLNWTQVSDAGLAHFPKDCKNLTNLDLAGTQLSDASLGHFKDCKNLAQLLLQKTKVTAAKIEELKKVLPKCKIDWDGVDNAWVKQVAAMPAEQQVEAVRSKLKDLNPGFDGKLTHKVDGGVVTELRFVTDKVTDISPIQVFNALRVLDCSGTSTLDFRPNGQLADLTPLKGMNLAGLMELNLGWTKVSDESLVHFKDCKNLTSLCLAGPEVSNAGLVHFKDCKNLTSLCLVGPEVSDAGLVHFKDCKNLWNLWLARTQVSDAGLAYFKDCKNLWWLGLAGTQVSDAGLANFKDCTNLRVLELIGTKVSDAGLAYFKDCKNLWGLNVNDTQVTDAGVAYFKDCTNLRVLRLQKTKVTAAKIEELKKALPKCNIDWDGVIEPKEK